MKLHTNVFQHSKPIPQKYTCDGVNVSPELKWEEAPANTKSFALICDDPDAPSGTFVHWVLYGLEPSSNQLPEGVPAKHEVDSPKCMQGINDFGRTGYGGPCPPRGPAHHYFFKLYALDQEIQLASKGKKRDLEMAMDGHVLEQVELMGTYQRK